MRPIFRGFCINRFGIGPLHYISNRSDFGLEFPEIFVIEKNSGSHRFSYSGSRGLFDLARRSVGYRMFKRKLPTSVSRMTSTTRIAESTRQVGESLTFKLAESRSRYGESGSRYSKFFYLSSIYKTLNS
jgi:hypothetical protein